MSILHGCDLSMWQSETPSGLDFYIIKASEGVGYQDPALNRHYNTVHEMGKRYGFYHFARPDLGNSPEAEADWFLSLVGQHAGSCIYALDWEGKSLDYPAEWALNWMQRVYEKTGVRPVLYASASYINSGKYAPIAKENYGLWIAEYNGQDNPTLSSFSGWTSWAFWQYTDTPYDQDYFNGNASAYDKYCASDHKKTPDPKPQPAEKSYKEIAQEVINGKWGNGQERINRLKAAGYFPAVIQELVNQILTPKKSIDQIAQEVISGKWGNGQKRINRLKAAGYNASAIQSKVDEIYTIAKNTARGDYGNDPERSITLKNMGYDPAFIQSMINKGLV